MMIRNLKLANSLTLSKETLPKEAENILFSFYKNRHSLYYKEESIAFTMAETITVLVILGIIAVITIPSLLKNYRLSIYRTKVKKAMEVYSQVINNVASDSGVFRDTAALNTWASPAGDCSRSRQYFRIIKEGNNPCRFRTPDGIWWDISSIINPVISLKDEITNANYSDIVANAKDINADKTSFIMTARLDEIADLQIYKGIRGGIRINDQGYERQICGNAVADVANRAYLAKLYEFIYRDKYEQIANNDPNIGNCPDPTPDPTDPTDPTNPTNPTEPTHPTNPTNPTEPTHPTSPTNPTEPTHPTNPTNPTNPTYPTEPTNPTYPTYNPTIEPTVEPTINPTNPTYPTEPTDPTYPTEPTDPTYPTEPTDPTYPTPDPTYPTPDPTVPDPTPDPTVPDPTPDPTFPGGGGSYCDINLGYCIYLKHRQNEFNAGDDNPIPENIYERTENRCGYGPRTSCFVATGTEGNVSYMYYDANGIVRGTFLEIRDMYLDYDRDVYGNIQNVTVYYGGSNYQYQTYTYSEFYPEFTNNANYKYCSGTESNLGIAQYLDEFKAFGCKTNNSNIIVCLAKDTMVTLADGSKKAIQDINFNDELKVWDFDNGCIASAKPLWIKIPEVTDRYNLLTFSDGRTLKTINQHRIFNKEAGKYTYPMTDETPIGTTTLLEDGSEVKLVKKEVIEEPVEFYNVITEYHFNLFAEGISTSNRFSNLYPIKDLKYVKDDRKLTPYEEFKGIPYEWYVGLRLAEQPLDINRDGADRHDNSLNEYVLRLMRTSIRQVAVV